MSPPPTATVARPATVEAPTVAIGLGRAAADIQGLRALAVTAVVIYHLWPSLLSGGYVGVDVFFAISGFLITSHLLAEVDRTGRLRPARFWARRAKRLVPASTIVLLFTAAGGPAMGAPARSPQFFDEITAAALQVENWVLAPNSVNYLAASNAPPRRSTSGRSASRNRSTSRCRC